eukprot:364407-Chlamydomonas_euryale.AAC.4
MHQETCAQNLPGDGTYRKLYRRYEAAANLVDGLPKLVPAMVKPGRVTETADAIAGKAGAGAAHAVVTGGLMALTLTSTATAGVGLIRGVVKRRRVKKAIGSVDAALQEMRRARNWLAALAQGHGNAPGSTGWMAAAAQGHD